MYAASMNLEDMSDWVSEVARRVGGTGVQVMDTDFSNYDATHSPSSGKLYMWLLKQFGAGREFPWFESLQ